MFIHIVRNVIFLLLGKNDSIWHPKLSFAEKCGRDLLKPMQLEQVWKKWDKWDAFPFIT
jgi:hypothetical protein